MKPAIKVKIRQEQKTSRKETKYRYLLFHKPYGVLCQFTDPAGRVTLSGFGPFPSGVYPTGRLDYDSEGLVLLTDDGALQHILLDPRYRHWRTYVVQVERIPDNAALERLHSGVVIEGEKTLPARVRRLEREPDFPERSVPIRFRKNIPTCWIEIILSEGRNRQVRKMTAAVGHPTLRLVRTAIANLTIAGLQPGEHRTVTTAELTSLMKLLRPKNTNEKNRLPRRAGAL